jgi:hypothetical protein
MHCERTASAKDRTARGWRAHCRRTARDWRSAGAALQAHCPVCCPNSIENFQWHCAERSESAQNLRQRQCHPPHANAACRWAERTWIGPAGSAGAIERHAKARSLRSAGRGGARTRTEAGVRVVRLGERRPAHPAAPQEPRERGRARRQGHKQARPGSASAGRSGAP